MPDFELPQDRPPLFVPAGLIKNLETMKLYSQSPDIAVQVLGSFTLYKNSVDRYGRPLMAYDEREGAAYNLGRLENCGQAAASRFIRIGLPHAEAAGQKVVISAAALAYEDPRKVMPRMASWARGLGVHGFEIDASCPKLLEMLSDDPEMTFQTFEATRREVGNDFYIIGKFGNLSADEVKTFVTGRLAADAISTTNALRYPHRRLSSLKTEPLPDGQNPYPGYSQSGPVIQALSRHNARLWRATDYEVWSSGGIEDGLEAYHRVHGLGAVAVGMAQKPARSPDPVGVFAETAAEYRHLVANVANRSEFVRLSPEAELTV